MQAGMSLLWQRNDSICRQYINKRTIFKWKSPLVQNERSVGRLHGEMYFSFYKDFLLSQLPFSSSWHLRRLRSALWWPRLWTRAFRAAAMELTAAAPRWLDTKSRVVSRVFSCPSGSAFQLHAASNGERLLKSSEILWSPKFGLEGKRGRWNQNVWSGSLIATDNGDLVFRICSCVRLHAWQLHAAFTISAFQERLFKSYSLLALYWLVGQKGEDAEITW